MDWVQGNSTLVHLLVIALCLFVSGPDWGGPVTIRMNADEECSP